MRLIVRLSTQCFSSLAHEATSKERLVPGASSSSPLRLFALTKFVDVVMHNLHRVLTLWPLVTQLLLPAANHKAQRIRIVGTEALAKVVIAAMRHHMHARAKLKDMSVLTQAATPNGLEDNTGKQKSVANKKKVTRSILTARSRGNSSQRELTPDAFEPKMSPEKLNTTRVMMRTIDSLPKTASFKNFPSQS